MNSKLFHIVALIFLAVNVSNAQYIPFVEEGKFWIYQNHENLDFPSPVSGHAITFKGDTIINSLTYKKVYKLNLKGEQVCPVWEMPCWGFIYPYQTESKVLVSFIREDTIGKKIYNLPNASNDFCETEEYLLFDFSLNVGDTVNNCVYESIWAGNNNLFLGGIVDSIKTIELHNKFRNTIFTYGFYTIIGLPYETTIPIAEGLGFQDHGIFYKPQSAFVDYCEGEMEQCNLILSNESTHLQKEINIFPNPSNGMFEVSSNLENLKSLRAYSTLGQLRKESKFTNKIDLSNLESGLYLLEITTKDDERIIRKIVIDN